MVQAGSSLARKWDDDFHNPAANVNDRQYRRVKKKYKQVNPHKALLVRVSVFLFAYGLLIVFLCIKSATLGYQIVQLQNDIAKTEAANHKLEYSIAQQTSLKRVEMIASTQLGMYPAKNQFQFTIEAPPKMQVAGRNLAAQPVEMGDKTLRSIYKNLRILAQKTN
ncbi:hypothetical protein [Syntrophomonas palmitatica]|uniref:hypothetical protein n=1 Tax=Syntrophomonas palmitatica TaxID=402877 RepID=UPI0006D26C6C|nr:hypothetical protein [Syntrophomonas palmitatica]